MTLNLLQRLFIKDEIIESLQSELNQLQIRELEINSNYSRKLQSELTKNNQRQYEIIDYFRQQKLL